MDLFRKNRKAAGRPDTEDSSEEIWEKFRGGDEKAFACIYQRYVKLVFNYAKLYSSSETLIEDCIQELFVDLWRRREFLSSVVSVRFYLYKAIKRKIKYEQVRRKKDLERSQDTDYFQEGESSREDLIIEGEQEESFQQLLESQLAALTQLQREAIYLRYFKDMSPKEIAVVMGESLANVYKLITRGMSVLKKNLSQPDVLLSIVLVLSLLVLP